MRSVLCALGLAAVGACGAGRTGATPAAPTPAPAAFDQARAARLGADAYGMRSYVIAFLRRGPTPPADPAEVAALQRAHLDNIGRLADAGKLVLAGPFADDGELRGLYVFAVATLPEAEALTRTDPAIAAGALQLELHPWYGTAALLEVPAIHRAIAHDAP